jgi:hypothetical protein
MSRVLLGHIQAIALLPHLGWPLPLPVAVAVAPIAAVAGVAVDALPIACVLNSVGLGLSFYGKSHLVTICGVVAVAVVWLWYGVEVSGSG